MDNDLIKRAALMMVANAPQTNRIAGNAKRTNVHEWMLTLSRRNLPKVQATIKVASPIARAKYGASLNEDLE